MALPSLCDVLLSKQADMVERLREYVVFESPSHDKDALDGLARVIGAHFEAVGADVEYVPNMTGGDHLCARWGAGTERPAFILGHFDTVWPAGTLARQPFRVEDGLAFGPGTYDMKSGLVMAEFALWALRALSLHPPRPVVVLFTSDEEIGSPTTRGWIEAQAQKSAYALVLEPPLPDGVLKTARKGVGKFTIEVDGKSAHAGIEPDKGVNAIVELAHQVLAIQALARPPETTINVGVIQGGTMTNVVPAQANAWVDVRVASRAEAERVENALHALRPVLPGATVKVTGRYNRPPMERTTGIQALFESAREVGLAVGQELSEGATGGASDGNFTASVGLPTLDGLGARGAGAHAVNEHIVIDSLPERAALIAALLMKL